MPRDQLFATLDVTVHAGQLPSHRKVLYVDTVGFISDIPTALVASFKSTLEDAIDAVRSLLQQHSSYQRVCLCVLDGGIVARLLVPDYLCVCVCVNVVLQDVIVHVRDISHPDATNQRRCVLDTLGQLELTPAQVDNVIEVCNKADLVQQDRYALQSIFFNNSNFILYYDVGILRV